MSTSARVGYNGVIHEPGTHWQLLGNGRRAYNPVLMRFHSPDRLSPFGAGGINGYAYCGNDPINLGDPSGQFAVPLMLLLGVAGGAGAAGAGALASSGSPGDEGGGSSALPWIIGGVIAALGAVAGAGMAGRQGPMKFTSTAGKAPAAPKVNVAVGKPAPSRAAAATANPPLDARSSSGSVAPIVRRDKKGMELRHMSELPEPVQQRIKDIRDFGPIGRTPDASKVQNAKWFENKAGKLPRDRSGHFYHQYPIFFGKGHGFEGYRIITGGTRRNGLMKIYGTPNHRDFFKVDDWRQV